jgi:putative acetyltransferase
MDTQRDAFEEDKELPRTRDARDSDRDGLCSLIKTCWADYEGLVFDLEGELQELLRPASSYQERNGRLFVVEHRGEIVASVGCVPSKDPSGLELQKLYVAPALRRGGIGSSLCRLVESLAREQGRSFVDLWTDTRFVEAHRLYRRLGYVQGEETRSHHDKSNTVEYYFRGALDLSQRQPEDR